MKPLTLEEFKKLVEKAKDLKSQTTIPFGPYHPDLVRQIEEILRNK